MSDPKKMAADDREVSLQVSVPEKVRRALKMRAAADGETMRGCILKALREYGIVVDEEDLKDRRRPDA